MKQPTAIIDKNVIHAISELAQNERNRIWNELKLRFRIVIPWVLIEEVWTNYGSPGKKKQSVVHAMVDQLKALRAYWVDDELNHVFEELIVKRGPLLHMSPPKEEIVSALFGLMPGDSKFQDFLVQQKAQKNDYLLKRIESQNSFETVLKTEGIPTLVSSEHQFIKKVIARIDAAIYRDENCRMHMLGPWLEAQLINQRPEYSRRIRRAIRSLNRVNKSRFPITSNCILAKLLYNCAPICRIHDGSRDGKPILKRKKGAQQGNGGDERFVANALMCDVLLTRDEGMANVMNCLRSANYWKGRTIFLKAQDQVSDQIPDLL